MPRMVLLRHDTPDGLCHLDWLSQRPGPRGCPEPDPDERCLISFRTHAPVHDKQITAFVAQRLPDHRVHYLDYQGDLGVGRGSVRRLAIGIVRAVQEMDGAIAVRGRWSGGDEFVWAGKLEGDAWAFVRSAPIIKMPPTRGPIDLGPEVNGVWGPGQLGADLLGGAMGGLVSM